MPAYLRDPFGGGSAALLADPFSPLALHVVSASVDVFFAGGSIDIVFSEAVSFGAGGNGGVTLSSPAGALSYVSGSGTNTLRYAYEPSPRSGQVYTFSYTQPANGIQSVDDGEDLPSFTGFPVTNNSALYLSISGSWPTTYQRGASNSLQIATPPVAPTTGNTTITLGGEAVTVDSVSGSGPYTINYTVPAAIALQHNAGAAYQVQVTVGTETITDGTLRPLTAVTGWSFQATDDSLAVLDQTASVYYTENPVERAANLAKLVSGQLTRETLLTPSNRAFTITDEGFINIVDWDIDPLSTDQTFDLYLIESDGTINTTYTYTIQLAINAVVTLPFRVQSLSSQFAVSPLGRLNGLLEQ